MGFFQKVATAVVCLLSLSNAAPSHMGNGDRTISAKRAISSVVTGTPVGFGASTTGGGTAVPVYPSTIAQLKSYLTSSSPQVIVISGTYDFTGSEGTTSYQACNTYSCNPTNGGQALLNTLNGCSGSTYAVSVDTAAYNPIWVKSDKTLVGHNGATLKGKGLRLSGVKNIIIQNIAITDLNPKYVWGGDAIAMTDTSNIWIDHVTTRSLGRQHYSFGQGANTAVTISNSFLDGTTSYSATCNGQTYWGLEMVGANDRVTFYRNHMYRFSGRGPALSGSTLFHAVNNMITDNGGHMLEGDSNGRGLYEGNVLKGIKTPIASGSKLKIFSSGSVSACAASLGRNCQSNLLTNSGAFTGTDTSFFSEFKGQNIPPAKAASTVEADVVPKSGNTL